MDARAQPRAANFHRGGRVAGCGEFGVACGGGQEGEQGREGGWRALYLGVSFQDQESLHACSLVSFWPGRARGEEKREGYMYIEGGRGEQISCGEAECIWRVDFLKGG